jgi:5-methylcytosine-specific restriction endonuclease McrA
MSSEEKKEYHRKNREAGSLEQRRAKARRKAKSSAGKARSAANRHRRRARIKGNGGSWTGKQWVALKAAHEGKCLGCGRTETEVIAMGRKLVPDHIKPLSLGGANSIENLQPLCHGDGSSCNMLKSARWIDYRPGFPLEIA